MRGVEIALMGASLAFAIGCGEKSGDVKTQSPETSNAAGEKSVADTTVAAKPSVNETQKAPVGNLAGQKTPAKTVALNSSKENPPPKPSIEKPAPQIPDTSKPVPDDTFPEEFAGFQYLPSNAVALLSAKPAAILNHPIIKSLPPEVLSIDNFLKTKRLLNSDPREMTRWTQAIWFDANDSKGAVARSVLLGRLGLNEILPAGSLKLVAILNFVQPIDTARLEQDGFKLTWHKGAAYWTNEVDSIYLPNPKTMVVTKNADLPSLLDHQGESKLAVSTVKTGLDHDLSVVVGLNMLRDQLRPRALWFDELIPGLADVPDELETLSAHANLNEGLDLNAVVDTNAESAAKTIEKSSAFGREKLGEYLPMISQSVKQELGEALGGEVSALAANVAASLAGKVDGKQFHLSAKVPRSAIDVLQKVAKSQKVKAKSLAGQGNLKQLMIASHNYHEAFKVFPFPSGRPDAPQAQREKLSWRVHLLPYLDEATLYKQFKLDEAWDSEHNMALLEKMPKIYQLSESAKPGHSQFVAPQGEGFVVDGEVARRISQISDGTALTIVILSVKPEKAVPWTKPGGLEIDPAKAADILGGDGDRFLAALASGKVVSLSPKLDAKSLKALLTIGGREDIEKSVLDPSQP